MCRKRRPMMAYVIQSVEEFLAHLKVGDQFWFMNSFHCKPFGITGPYTIKRIEDGPFFGEKDAKIFYDHPSFINPGTMVEASYFVSHKKNHFRGFFLQQKTPLKYLGEKSAMTLVCE